MHIVGTSIKLDAENKGGHLQTLVGSEYADQWSPRSR